MSNVNDGLCNVSKKRIKWTMDQRKAYCERIKTLWFGTKEARERGEGVVRRWLQEIDNSRR